MGNIVNSFKHVFFLLFLVCEGPPKDLDRMNDEAHTIQFPAVMYSTEVAISLLQESCLVSRVGNYVHFLRVGTRGDESTVFTYK